MAEHTPWYWERWGCRVWGANRKKVADVSASWIEEVELNKRGHLIAAAPELLKALKEAPELPLRMTAGEVEEFIVKYASWRLGWATLALDAATKEKPK